MFNLALFILNKTISVVWALVSFMENRSNNVFLCVLNNPVNVSTAATKPAPGKKAQVQDVFFFALTPGYIP